MCLLLIFDHPFELSIATTLKEYSSCFDRTFIISESCQEKDHGDLTLDLNFVCISVPQAFFGACRICTVFVLVDFDRIHVGFATEKAAGRNGWETLARR